MQDFFTERRGDILMHAELHALMLHLYKPVDFPIKLEAFLASLKGELRALADQVLFNYRLGGSSQKVFGQLASAIEEATLKVLGELEALD